MNEEGSSTIYGFSCMRSPQPATSRLLLWSSGDGTDSYKQQTPLQAFLDGFNQSRAEDGEKGVDRKVRGSGSGNTWGEGINYSFSHFDEPEKHMQRYRYYHTVHDTGQASLDPQALGIEVPGCEAADDKTDSSSQCTSSFGAKEEGLRELLLMTRKWRSPLSSSSPVQRNKSADCDSSRSSPKRVYLSWEEYVRLYRPEVHYGQAQKHIEASERLVLQLKEQATPRLTRRNISSVTNRSPHFAVAPSKRQSSLSVPEKGPTFIFQTEPQTGHQRVQTCSYIDMGKGMINKMAAPRGGYRYPRNKRFIQSATVLTKQQRNGKTENTFTEGDTKSVSVSKIVELIKSLEESGQNTTEIVEKNSHQLWSALMQIRDVTPKRQDSRVHALYKFSKTRRKQNRL